MAVQIQLRRDTASNWTSANPTLAAGEFAVETDTDKYKIGDGSTAWPSLGYSSLPSNAITTAGGVTITGTMTHGADGTGADVRFNSGTAGDYAMWDASEEKLILEGTHAATVLDITDGNVVVGDGTLTVGSDGAGEDVTFHSDTSGDYLQWDSSAEKLILEGTNGATVLDVTDGNVVIADGTLTVGSDGAGEDVTFYSDTAGDSMVWDSSAESLTITGTDGQTALNVADGNVVIADSLTAGTITSGTVTMGDDRIDGAMLKDYSEKGYNVGTTGAITRDFSLTNGNTHWTTLTGNATFTFSYPVASGDVSTLTLIVTQDGTGSRTIAWPGAVDWAGGTAPTISTAANAVDIFTFITHDAGTTWYGFAAGLDMKSPS